MAPNVEVLSIHVEPNDCPLNQALNMDIKFNLDEALQDAMWKVCFMVDMAYKRKIVELGETPITSYSAGESSMHFSTPELDFIGVKRSMLNNAGLLLANLIDAEGKEVFQISMVTQVMAQGDTLMRTILSPLD